MITFDKHDVRDVMAGKASLGTVFAALTSQTCGEPCWHAREEICRCSCGGRNHGCLTHADGIAPDRTAKIDGERYKLIAVGNYRDLLPEAHAVNNAAGWKSVEKPKLIIDSIGSNWTEQEISDAKTRGLEMWFSQYKYHWSETDPGAPARLKSVSVSQRQWKELAGWKDIPAVSLLWQRVTMPERPANLVVDKQTGQPLENQNPL